MDKNRRGFMTWIAGFLGLGAVTPAIAAVPKPKLEGFIVFFVHIGSLVPFRAEAYIERIKNQWKKDLPAKDLIANWQAFFIPTRTEDTHAEFYPINGEKDIEGKLKMVEGFLLNYEDKASHPGASVDIDSPELKLKVVDYVMLMLGAPVVKIELDQQQLNTAYDTAVLHIKSTGNAINSVYLTENFLKDGVLAFAKMMLGRVRSKFINPPGPSERLVIDGPALLEEGREEITEWKERLEKMM